MTRTRLRICNQSGRIRWDDALRRLGYSDLAISNLRRKEQQRVEQRTNSVERQHGSIAGRQRITRTHQLRLLKLRVVHSLDLRSKTLTHVRTLARRATAVNKDRDTSSGGGL